MTPTWQDIAVWVIGAVVAVVLIRRAVCALRGRGRGGCTSCASTGCPLHGVGKRKGQ